MVEGLVQRYDDSENWFVRWEEEERRCEDDFLVPVPFWKIGLMLLPWDAASQISDFRSWPVQQQYFRRCSQWREDKMTGDMEVPESSGDDLDVLATAQEKKFIPWRHWPQTTGHCEKPERSNTRYGWHGVSFLNNSHLPTATTGDWNGSVSFAEDHTGPQCPENRGRTAEKKGDATAHVAYRKFAISLHTETSMFSQEALETGWALIDCGATRCMGSWKELDGLARMNEELCGSPRLSLDRTRQTWYTFANEERPHSERVVAFQVNVGGKMGDWKIAYLIATGEPIFLSVQSISKMDAIMDFSTGATFFFFEIWQTRSLSNWNKRQMWRLYLWLAKDMLSQSICDEDLLLGFQAAARVLETPRKKGQDTPSAHADGGTGELLKEGWDGKNLCLDDITAQQPYQRHWLKPTHRTSYNRSHAGRLHVTNHWCTTATGFNAAFHHRSRVLTSSMWWTCFPCHDRMSTISGRTNALNWWDSWERHNPVGECWWWNWRPWSKTCFYQEKVDRNSLSRVSQKWTGVNLRKRPESWMFQ